MLIVKRFLMHLAGLCGLSFTWKHRVIRKFASIEIALIKFDVNLRPREHTWIDNEPNPSLFWDRVIDKLTHSAWLASLFQSINLRLLVGKVLLAISDSKRSDSVGFQLFLSLGCGFYRIQLRGKHRLSIHKRPLVVRYTHIFRAI